MSSSGYKNKEVLGFPGGSVVKNWPANAGDTGSIPDPGRSHIPRRNEPPAVSARAVIVGGEQAV